MREATSLSAPLAELVASMLGEGRDVRLRLSGWSMKPWFRSGAVVRFSSTSTPSVGDVALTRHANDALVAHRIIALGADWVQTKGDACHEMDARVERTSLLGCAVALDSARLGLTVPLANALSRSLGRWTNRVYPLLVRAFRALHSRKDRLLC